ncbi:2-oxoglutarate dehydrogenase [Xanthomonas arboricola]|uniref:2-oxoglutarate dehydrogenase n=1 Tax=Xanthomonas arboricola TaxID=56448 RepID=UPI000CEF16C0|nr:2-oxoglutarate dehydrogenase [Xanthomonas arboricola]PPU38388.1 hypothetical protein XaplCFBP3123_18115 [Xanthomonas arboricola pv. populi]
MHRSTFLQALRYCTPLFALLASAVGAQSLPMQSVSAVGHSNGGGVDGPFRPKSQPTSAPPTADSVGDTLEAQAQQRIASSLGANGALAQHKAITKQEAQANGLGFVATHFEQIDLTHSGRVTLDDVKAYVQQRQR